MRRWQGHAAVVLAGMLGCALFPGCAKCGALRIALLAEVKVSGDAILLANLLPREVSGSVRERANEIWLARTPQNGTTRCLRGAVVAEAIKRGGMPIAAFAIPEEISVERAGRMLNSEEILASVRVALGRFSLSQDAKWALRELKEEEITWESELRVPPGGARLKVLAISLDLRAGQARIRMAAEAENHTVPFEVLAHMAPITTPAVKAVRTARTADGVEFASVPREPETKLSVEAAPDTPVLVLAGKSARLRLHSENSNIALEVKALEPGHAGETIRVRIPANGKTLRAQVVGEHELEASF
jgi:Chaperone for flagella basal body P-ring formation